MSSSWKKSRDVEAQAFQRLKDSLGDQFLFSQLIEDRLCPDFLIARKDEMSAADATHMLGVHDAETLSQFRSSEFSSKTLSISRTLHNRCRGRAFFAGFFALLLSCVCLFGK